MPESVGGTRKAEDIPVLFPAQDDEKRRRGSREMLFMFHVSRDVWRSGPKELAGPERPGGKPHEMTWLYLTQGLRW